MAIRRLIVSPAMDFRSKRSIAPWGDNNILVSG